jgi:hypothetical protein
MMKAYDRVDWSFLRLVLLQIGINLEAIEWIMGCVRSINLSVNQWKPSGFFRSSTGLRQGSPLSPLLFSIIFEGLSRILRNIFEEGKIQGVSIEMGLELLIYFF